nr:hypothetical protein Iba_chr02dCG7030 [Ipomoea batatas]
MGKIKIDDGMVQAGMTKRELGAGGCAGGVRDIATALLVVLASFLVLRVRPRAYGPCKDENIEVVALGEGPCKNGSSLGYHAMMMSSSLAKEQTSCSVDLGFLFFTLEVFEYEFSPPEGAIRWDWS